MNFRIQLFPVAILSTGAAIDNDTVFGSLKMARAALDGMVYAEMACITADYFKGIEALKFATRERRRDLRAARKVAIRVREADLSSDETVPVSGPPAASIAVEAPDPQVPAEEVEQAGAASDDLLAVPAFLRRAGA